MADGRTELPHCPATPGFVPGTLDPTYPSVPGVPTTAGNLSSDGTIVTNVTTPTFNGTADPGTTVALMEGTTVLGQTTAATFRAMVDHGPRR